MSVRLSELETPVGTIRLAVRGPHETLVALAYADHFERVLEPVLARFDGEPIEEGPTDAAQVLEAYLGGDLTAIDDIEVDVTGTDFRRRVWAALRQIPAGETCSYRDLAAEVGRPAATRAVGTANGANPVWVVVPCHRVIRSDGTLGGYGGGLERKRWLLDHEGVGTLF